MSAPKSCFLVFDDGDVHRGSHFGHDGESCGELVFNTAMSGYQEVITDPSYKGQVVLMTYPSIGNYGINSEDVESDGCYLHGFVISELSPTVSNQRAETDLSSYLAENGIVGIAGVDTRAIVRKVRTIGSPRVILSSVDSDPASLLAKVQAWPGIQGKDMVREVTCT